MSNMSNMSVPLLTESPITSEFTITCDNAINPDDPGNPTTTATPSPEESCKSPLAIREMFFPLSFCAPPAPIPASGLPGLLEQPPTNASEYDKAIARVRFLDTFLTPGMRCTLTSMLSVMDRHLTPPDGLHTHPLITRVASPDHTPDECVKDLVDIIEKGLSIFAALGGGSVKKSESETPTGTSKNRFDTDGNPVKTTRRSMKIRTACKLRDPGCQICNSDNTGEVCHIIPYSVKDEKAVDFWKFVELFRGVEATAALKAVALAPNPEIVDNMKNVWFLCKICHDNFDRAKISIIPDLDDLTYPYDAAVITSYKATVEFPSAKKFTTIACWKYDEDGDLEFDGKLLPGRVISLTTCDALDLPLPHPLLFQLHALICRVVGLKAAAGFPLFPNFDGGDPDDRGVPVFTDNAFVDWLSHHEQPISDSNPLLDSSRYDSGGAKSHTIRWLELTPLSITHVLAPPDFSDSESDYDAQHPLKREHLDDSDTDEERPRKVQVVLGEIEQRLLEKQQLSMSQGIGLYECN